MRKLRLQDVPQATRHLSRRAEVQSLAADSRTGGPKRCPSASISSACISVSLSLPVSILAIGMFICPSSRSLQSMLFYLHFLFSFSVPQFRFHNLFFFKCLCHAKIFLSLDSVSLCLCPLVSVCLNLPPASVSPTWLVPASGPGGH